MSTATVNDEAWLKHPYTYRNNRGCTKTSDGRFLRYGIPEPRGHEKPEDKKGGDRIGFDEIVITADMVGKKVAVFTSIEIKGFGDVLKEGQANWHNFVIQHGGKSEIWKEQADGSINIIDKEI